MKTNRTSTVRRAGPFCLGLVAASLLSSCAELDQALDQALVAAIGAAGAQGYAHTSGYAPSTHSAWNSMNPANFSLKPNHYDWEQVARNAAMNYARTAAWQAMRPRPRVQRTVATPGTGFVSTTSSHAATSAPAFVPRGAITVHVIDPRTGAVVASSGPIPLAQEIAFKSQYPGYGFLNEQL